MMGASETVTRQMIDEMCDCAVLWVSADANHPDTPSPELQAAINLCQQAPAMRQLISLTVRTLNDRLAVITDEAAHDVLTDIRDAGQMLLKATAPQTVGRAGQDAHAQPPQGGASQ